MNSNIKKLRITVGGKKFDVTVEVLGEPEAMPSNNHVHLQTNTVVQGSAQIAAPLVAPAARPAAAGAGAVACPLSGTIVQVHVTEGQAVKEGDLLVTLEAMKMNTPVRAPSGGTVRQLAAKQGAVFEEGAALLVLE